MKKCSRLSAFIVALCVVAACGNVKKTTNDKTTPVAVATTTDSTTAATLTAKNDSIAHLPQVYQAARTIYTDLIHTKLVVRPDWDKSYLYGVETLTAKPHYYPSDSLILDARGMTINSVKMGDKMLNYTYENNVLRINLGRTYTRNEQYTITIDYISKPDELKNTDGSDAITSDKGLYFINPHNEKGGYEPQIWTQGESQSNSVWFPTIDSPNMKSTEEMYITVADKYKTLSNGRLVESKKNADGTRTDHWVQEQPHAPYLFMFFVGDFAEIKDSYTKKDGTKIDVNYFVEHKWEKQARKIFGETPEMIKFFSNLLGVEYQWDKYDQVVVREYVSGAMENTTATVFGDFVYKDDNELADGNDEAVIAHELFHHWFGDLVTTESWSNLTVNESFANFSEILWDEYKHGLDVAQFNKEKDIDRYYDGMEPQHDLVWFTFKDRESMFDATTYNKGGAILNQLRAYLGDSAFFQGLHNYLEAHKFGTAEAQDLRLELEKVCGEDLNWYFNNWYYGKGYPTVDITYSYNYEKTKVSLKFNQTQLKEWQFFTIPMVVQYEDAAGMHTKKFKITQQNQVVDLPITGALKTIIVDPNKTLVGKFNFHSNLDFWKEQFAVAKNYLAKKEAINGYLEEQNNYNDLKEFVTEALKDPFYGVKLAVLEKLSDLSVVKTLDKMVDGTQLRDLAQNAKYYDVRSKALSLYMQSANSSNTEKLAFLDQLKNNEKSYHVLAAIIGAYGKLDPEKADTIVNEFTAKYNNSSIDFAVAEYYLSQHVKGKGDYFKNLFEKSTLGKKGNALLYYGYYAFSTSFDDMKEFLNVADKNYDQLRSYKTYVNQLVSQANEEIKAYIANADAELKKNKNDQKMIQMKNQLSTVQLELENFLKKHPEGTN